jgi:hypothetical protein
MVKIIPIIKCLIICKTYSTFNLIRTVKSRKMGWDGLLGRMGDTGDYCSMCTVKCVCLNYVPTYAYAIEVYQ